MTGTDLLAVYTQLADTVGRMLQLARELQWAPLPALDAHCTDLFVQLKEAGVPAGFPGAQRAEVEALTQRIGEDQRALQQLLRPEFEHVARSMARAHGGR